VEHVWDDAVALGADHALVLADIALPSSGGRRSPRD
jgi:hypothetical protein